MLEQRGKGLLIEEKLQSVANELSVFLPMSCVHSLARYEESSEDSSDPIE